MQHAEESDYTPCPATFVCSVVECGIPIDVLAKILGH